MAELTPISSTAPVIDLAKLRAYAAVPENQLADICLALEVSEQDIRAAVSPKTWEEFQQQCVRVSEVRRRATINTAAESGDLKRIEYLQAAVKKTDGCKSCARAAAMTEDQLRAEITKLQAVIAMPATTAERWPNLSWA